MRNKSILVVLLSIIFLIGCGGSDKTETAKLPSNNRDFFFLETENCYVDLHADAVFFRLLSSRPLTKDDVSAKLDLPDSYYSLSFEEAASISLIAMDHSENHSTFSQDIFLCYQDIEWKEYKRLFDLSEEMRIEGNFEAFTEYLNQMEALVEPFAAEFEVIDPDNIPVLYQHGIYIQLMTENRPPEYFKATELTLTVNGKTQKYALEDLIYSAKLEGQYRSFIRIIC